MLKLYGKRMFLKQSPCMGSSSSCTMQLCNLVVMHTSAILFLSRCTNLRLYKGYGSYSVVVFSAAMSDGCSLVGCSDKPAPSGCRCDRKCGCRGDCCPDYIPVCSTFVITIVYVQSFEWCMHNAPNSSKYTNI